VRAGLVTGIGIGLGFPAHARRAFAAEPIKIGLPAALSGGNAQYGIQAKRKILSDNALRLCPRLRAS